MGQNAGVPLRVLVANEDRTRLEELALVAAEIGDEVVAREIMVTEVADAARAVLPDVAIVGLHDHRTEHALGLIVELVREGTCPVVAVTVGEDPAFIRSAAEQGIFAYSSSLDPDALRGAVDVARRRFGETQRLEGALGRRAIIERAKGLLMERYSLDESAAFDRLRDQSRRSGEKLVDVCLALLRAHPLLRDPPR